MHLPDFLRRTAVYRLALYYLLVLLAAAMGCTLLGILPYSPLNLAFSTLLIIGVCWLVNALFARSFGATSSLDSVLITGLILVLIITPMAPGDGKAIGFAVFASSWAMASKYMLTINRRHIFNPAAFGAVLAALTLGSSVTWWIGGSLYLLPFVIGGGILILLKMSCTEMLLAFAAAALGTVMLTSEPGLLAASLSQVVLHSMFFFFAFVMLTEPRTAPLGRYRRLAYGAIIGIFFAPEIHLGGFYTTPEIALLVGNAFALLSDRRLLQARPRTASA